MFGIEDNVSQKGNRYNLTSYNSMYPQPHKIETPLMSHQKTSLYEMVKMERTNQTETENGDILCSNIGLLSDMVGAGKSLTVLALTCLKHKIQGIWTPYFGSMRLLPKNYLDLNVILVPDNIIAQWERYIKEHTILSYTILPNPTLSGLRSCK